MPWPMTGEIFELADHEGVDRVVNRHAKRIVPFAAEDAIDDIDTPGEYQLALQSEAMKQKNIAKVTSNGQSCDH
jgi:hypothetical protein